MERRVNMKGKITIVLAILVVFVLCFNISSLAAEVQDEERLELIKASRELTEKQKQVYFKKLGLFATDFGSEGGEFNMGGKLELPLPESKLVFVTEGIYLKNIDNISCFVSMKVDPLADKFLAPYFGGGVEVTPYANYQAFVGLDIAKNFYVEAKYIDDDESEDDKDIYLSTGFQLNF